MFACSYTPLHSLGYFDPPERQPYRQLGWSDVNLPSSQALAQTAAVTQRVADIISADPDVDRVFQRVGVGNANINLVLKKDRARSSIEFERAVGPKLGMETQIIMRNLRTREDTPGT